MTTSPLASTALHAEHVVGGHAVFQAVCAAGVEGNVAADRADGLTGWIGRVVQTVRCGGSGDVQVDHARLDDRDPFVRIEFQNLVQPIQCDHDAIGDRQRTAGQTRAAAAGDERDAVVVAPANGRDDFIGRFRKHDGQRFGAKRSQPVRFERGLKGGVAHESIGREDVGKASEVDVGLTDNGGHIVWW